MTEQQDHTHALPEGFPLEAESARVVGALIEKSMTTPDNYPLSLNAVTTACNQVSNRNPVVDYSEDMVERTLRALADHGIASLYHKPGDRVVKYVHKLERALGIGPEATSVLAVLLLRGDQTPGELRQRTERYGTFDSPAAVEATLSEMMSFTPALVQRLPRQPGQKEQRYRQLIAGDLSTARTEFVPAVDTTPTATAPESDQPLASNAHDKLADRVARLERRLDALLDALGVDNI